MDIEIEIEIEIENCDDELRLLEYAIRTYEADDVAEEPAETHFQARIESTAINEDDSVCGSFSYYSKSGEFLGLDSESEWAGDISLKKPYSVSFKINPPEDTDRVKCQLGIRKSPKSAWDYAWPTFVILIFALLVSIIINVWI